MEEGEWTSAAEPPTTCVETDNVESDCPGCSSGV